MNVSEMHIQFRVLAQKMGMQTVRAILPEEIDICLNLGVDKVIDKTISDIYTSEINSAKSSGISLQTVLYNSKIGQLNAISTLISELEKEVVDYKISIVGNNIRNILAADIKYENDYYSTRIIPKEILQQTLRDFISRADKENPIITIENIEIDNYNISLYNENNISDFIKLYFIKNPVKISFSDNIDCDLISHVHNDVIYEAVNIYLTSIVGSVKN